MVKCPYCGNGEPDKFMYPDKYDGPYVICLACNGEFEEGEIEYYEDQSEEDESEEDQLISLNTITQFIDKEIQWCKDNQDQAPGDSAGWFIKGLEQAKHLIFEVSKINDFHDPLPDYDLPKNRPGYMGDYGGIPHGPFDL